MGNLLANPGGLTPIRHTNLALNNAGVRGPILVDFPDIALNVLKGMIDASLMQGKNK